MRKVLLTLLFLTAALGVLTGVVNGIGYFPFGIEPGVRRLQTLFSYGRFIAIPAAVFAFLYQRGTPTKTLAWVALMLGLPFLGTIVYLFFGLNVRQDLMFRKKRRRDAALLDEYQAQLNPRHTGADLFAALESGTGFNLARQRELVCRTTGADPSSVSAYRIYHRGQDLYDDMLADIAAARHHVHVEYFYFEDDWLGERVGEALMERARAGVEVRLIYDAVGSRRTKAKFWRKLEAAGCAVSPFFRVRFRHLANRINYRNHRKIVVIDGRLAYTGGSNVAKKYIVGLEELGSHWRDTHLRLVGPAVSLLQMTFAFDWRFVRGVELRAEIYFPTSWPEPGIVPVQIASSGPDTERNNIKFAYLNIITRAEEYVYFTTPYFTPDESVLAAMKTAALSGVDVRLILPERSDSTLVTLASNSFIAELLASRVRVFHYTRGMLHSKVVVADDIVVSIGTANMDSRSHDLNFEVNALLYGPEVARTEREILEQDMALHCRELSIENWPSPKLYKRLARGFARVFSPLL